MIEDLVQVKRSKRARRVALRLDPKARVVNLVVPEFMPLRKAYYFAEQHKDWVVDILNSLPDVKPFQDGEVISIFGDPVTIKIIYNPDFKRTKITQSDDQLLVETYQDDPTNRITTHLKKLARLGLADMSQDKASCINKTITSVSVRDTKSRWGSCSQDGELTYSWRLIFAPYHAIDYVVAHEVAHLVHMDHSQKFWKLCSELSSDYKSGKAWMKAHGNSLMGYGKQD